MFKRIFFLIVVSILLITSLIGCNNQQSSTTGSTTTGLEPPTGGGLSISPLPELGKVVDLTFNVTFHYSSLDQPSSGLANARSWIEFTWVDPSGSYEQAKYGNRIPAEDVLVNGNLSWQGKYDEGGSYLRAKIKLSREGIWIIRSYFTGEGWKYPVSNEAKYIVTKDTAELMNTPAFQNSSLSYFARFDYGEAGTPWAVDLLNETQYPTYAKLDITKAPLVNEEATVTLQIASIRDIDNYTAKIEFFKRLPDYSVIRVSPSDVVVSGDTEWTGSLQAKMPVDLAVVVKLPESGEWLIYGEAKFEGGAISNISGDAERIYMNVANNVSFFGWKKQEIK